MTTSPAGPGRGRKASPAMRLLYVTEGVPNRDPVHGDGSSMIPFEVIRHLPAGVRLTLLTFAGPVEVPAAVRDRCDRVVVLDPRSRRRALALSAVTSRSVGGARLATRAARAAVRRLSAAADVTLVHGPHATTLAPEVRGPLVVQVVDPWSLRVDMEAALATGPRAAYRRHKAAQALASEQALPARARLLSVSTADADRWSGLLGRPVRGIANGTDEVPGRWQRPTTPTICFVGSLSYPPNVESATILVKEVAPRLWRLVPDLRVVLAGRQPAPAVQALAGERVEVRANVPSVEDVFRSSSVAVFPDRHGLGVRNSVREAIACGVPVVATTAAAREQPAHPLLKIARDDEELVELTAAAVTQVGPTTSAPSGSESVDLPPQRTWRVVAEEYLDECARVLEPRAGSPQRA